MKILQLPDTNRILLNQAGMTCSSQDSVSCSILLAKLQRSNLVNEHNKFTSTLRIEFWRDPVVAVKPTGQDTVMQRQLKPK